MKVVAPSVSLVHATPNAEKVIEMAGRTCYKSAPDGVDSHVAFIQNLIKRGHDSVLEHASAGFNIVTERGMSHEIVRHRIGMSYSQESTRYCSYNKGRFGGEITIVRPSGISQDDYVWLLACQRAEESYLALLARGESPQNARSVLPTCTKTEIFVTGNLRAWRHFLRLRLAQAAHPDMRVLARMLLDELLVIAPTVFQDFATPHA